MHSIRIKITDSKCHDEESSCPKKAAASRRGWKTGASRQTVKITSEQSGQKAGFVRPVALNDIPPLRENVLLPYRKVLCGNVRCNRW